MNGYNFAKYGPIRMKFNTRIRLATGIFKAAENCKPEVNSIGEVPQY